MSSSRFLHRLRTCTLASFLLIANCTYVERASVGNAGYLPLKVSVGASVSGNGRFVAFHSLDNFGDNHDVGSYDVFLRDHQLGTTQRVSISSYGVRADRGGSNPAVSDNGNIVAFYSNATNLVPDDYNGKYDVFVRDRHNRRTTRVNVNNLSGETAGDLNPSLPAVSGDGRFVAFSSWANGLVPEDNDNSLDVFVRDLLLNATEIVSVDSNENHTTAKSFKPSISLDGRYVAFVSAATWGPLDTNGENDIYLRDRVAGVTTRVSIDAINSLQSDGASDNPSISGNGLYIAFESTSTNLVADDSNEAADVFVFDRTVGYTRRASTVSYGVGQADGASGTATISDNGRFVSFQSEASNLVGDDSNGVQDVFVKDMTTLRTFRASTGQSGQQSLSSAWLVYGASMSNDGRYVAFSTGEPLAEGDTNSVLDVYHRFALEPGPIFGGGTVAAGTSANVLLASAGWLDPVNIGGSIIPSDDIVVNNVIWTGFPGSEQAVIQITVAPGAAPGPRHIVLWNAGQWTVLGGASAMCANCLVVN